SATTFSPTGTSASGWSCSATWGSGPSAAFSAGGWRVGGEVRFSDDPSDSGGALHSGGAMRRSRLVVLGVVLALAMAACGSRTTAAQKLEALGAGRNGNGGASNENLAGSEGGGGATGGAAAGKSSAAGGASGKSAFSGDNGGSTDVGVTGNSITVSNVSILTGPVPGLFAGAFNGTDAYFQYINSQGGVYGRQLKVLPRDDQF